MADTLLILAGGALGIMAGLFVLACWVAGVEIARQRAEAKR